MIGFVACAAIAALVGGIGIFSLHQTGASVDRFINQGTDLRDLARQIEIASLSAQKNTGDFLLDHNWAYVDAVDGSVKAALGYIKSIKAALPVNDANQAALDKVAALAGDFQKGFHVVADDYKIKGNEESGRYGEFRTKAHEVEATVKKLGALQLERDYLEFRRNEKDYLLREDEAYIATSRESIATFKTHLDRSGIDRTTKAGIVALLADYGTLLDGVVQIDKEIRSATDAFDATVKNVGPIVATLVADFEKDATNEHDSMIGTKTIIMYLVIGTIIAAVAMALVLGLLMARGIQRPLLRIVDVAHQVASSSQQIATRVPPGRLGRADTGVHAGGNQRIDRRAHALRRTGVGACPVAIGLGGAVCKQHQAAAVHHRARVPDARRRHPDGA